MPDIEDLPAGRELDALVAEAMGKKVLKELGVEPK